MSVRKRRFPWRFLLLTAGATLVMAWMAAKAAAWVVSPAEHDATRVALTSVSPRAQASAPPDGKRVLGGFTSQGWPVVVVISRDRSHVVRVGIGLAMRCTSGDQFAQGDGGGPLPIGAGGKVRLEVTIPPAPGSTVSLVGGSDMFAGTLRHGGAAFAGVWDLHLVFRTADGKTDTCDSGRVTFAATG